MPALPTEFEMILAAEQSLGIPLLFYAKLLETPDDWTFVLKTQALFEGALKTVLRHTFTRQPSTASKPPDGWERFTYRQNVELALQFQILEPDYAPFLRELGRLRNRIVHNLQYLDLNLHKYSLALDPKQCEKWIAGIGAGWKNIPVPEFLAKFAPKERIEQLTRAVPGLKDMSLRQLMAGTAPRAAIWYSGVYTLDLLALRMHYQLVGGAWIPDPQLHASIQDLLTDPRVLSFQRDVSKKVSDAGMRVPSELFCTTLALLSIHEENGIDWLFRLLR